MNMNTYTGRVLALMMCLLLASTSVYADEWHFDNVERIVAVGDVHGAYDALVETLQKANVIGDDLAWSGGQTHLVSTGDLLDRGAESRRVMNLMMRLEREALEAGGRVHQLLGNHEVMNLIGDLRYVADEEYAAFQDFETPEDLRQTALPGYFGHRRAFAARGPYGRWLLEKPFMIVINDIAFVHGGAPSFVANYGLAGVNGAFKNDLLGFMEAYEALVKSGVITPLVQSKQAPKKLREMLEAGTLEGSDAANAERLIAYSQSPLHGQPGPTWYRGTSMCNRFVEVPGLTAALDEIGASRIVVGHTTSVSRQIQSRLGGRVYEIDTGMLNSVYGGSGNALVFESGQVSVVNQHLGAGYAPLEDPIQVGYEEGAVSEDDIAELLRTGEVSAVAAEGAEWQLVQIATENMSLFASFRALPGASEFAPELAAYRLDRALKLEMVPVTVRRSIAGRAGTLQFAPGVTITERERVAAGRGAQAICGVERQIGAMLVFDALINNEARSPSSMVYDRNEWLLMLLDHENAFSADESLPVDVVNVGLDVNDEWRVALRELDNKTLQLALGDSLNKDRLKALGKRRDALLSLND